MITFGTMADPLMQCCLVVKSKSELIIHHAHINATLVIRLDLHLGQAVLPDGDERSNTVLTVVEEDNPTKVRNSVCQHVQHATYMPSGSMDSPIRNS